jgi:hypothetical protein
LQDSTEVPTLLPVRASPDNGSTTLTYSVHFRVDLRKVPDAALAEIRRTMEEIGEALSTVTPSSPFWTSMKDSLLQIEVKRWRVVYRVDQGLEDIQVVELSRTRS